MNDSTHICPLTAPLLNTITGRSRAPAKAADTFKIDGDTVTDSNQITDGFCSYFANIVNFFL